MSLTKGVADRHHSAQFVCNLGRDHEVTIATGIGRRLGEPAAKSVIGVLRPAIETLEADDAAMVRAENDYLAILSDDPRNRTDRTVVFERLEDRMQRFRAVIAAGLGPEGVRAFGFDGKTPDTPEALCRHAEYLLEKGEAIAAAHVTEGWHGIDVAGFLAAIRDDTTDLRRRIGTVATDVREAKDALDTKKAAIKKHDETFGPVAQMIESWLLLAGQPGLAARVRPSPGRPGRTDVTPPENAEDVPPADAPSDDVA